MARRKVSEQSQSKSTPETSNKKYKPWVSYNGTCARFEGAKRMPLDKKRRAEIRQLQEIGVCSRCSRLKKRCSLGHLCDPCKTLTSSHISMTPWSMVCVRPRFGELNIFCQDSDLGSRFQDLSVQSLMKYHLKDNPVPSDWGDMFEEQFNWTPNELSRRLFHWLSNDSPIIHLMAVFNSTQFRELASRHVEESFIGDLKIFLSLGFVLRAKHKFPGYSENSEFDRDLLLSVRNFKGNKVLTWLNDKLQSFRVDIRSEETKEKYQVVFLMLLRTTLAICLVTDKGSNDVRKRLRQLLSLHMLLIGNALGISEIKEFDFIDPVERAWDKVKFFSLEHQLGGENYWFQDTELSSHHSLRRKNCPCCGKYCTPEAKCCQRCYRHAQLGEEQSDLTSGGSPTPDPEGLTYGRGMDKCVRCGFHWPEQKLDKKRLCCGCHEDSRSPDANDGTSSLQQNSFGVETVQTTTSSQSALDILSPKSTSTYHEPKSGVHTS